MDNLETEFPRTRQPGTTPRTDIDNRAISSGHINALPNNAYVRVPEHAHVSRKRPHDGASSTVPKRQYIPSHDNASEEPSEQSSPSGETETVSHGE